MKINIVTYSELAHTFLDFWGKCNGISWLLKNGFQIPRWCIIPADLLNISESDILEIVSHTNESGPWICRSSATNEDGISASFAWLYTSDIIHDIFNINNAILRMRKWAKNDNISLYAKSKNITPWVLHILVQEYIDGTISGVFFSNLFGEWPLIEYVNWTCNLLVDGIVNADKIWINQIDIKKLDPLLFNLYQQCMEIYTLYWVHVDIEWTIKDKQIYFLQVRPIVIF